MPLFEVARKKEVLSDKYTHSTNIPQYTPSNIKPNILELCDYTKYSKLIASINKSNISEEEKKFLKYAATRHIVFNYSKIADYYAHASKEMQELMEKSALVIIDFNDAILNGYVDLSKEIDALVKRGDNYAE